MKDRTLKIRDIILEHGEIRVNELCGMFPDISPMTLRRDLAELEQARQIIRTHGGARIYQASSREPWYADREQSGAAQKAEIAKKAAELARQARCLYLDAGTSAMALARVLPDERIIVITSAVNVASELVSRQSAYQVILLGGALNPKTLSCSGNDAIRQLEELNVEMAFMGTSGFSESGGFTVGDYAECELKRLVIQRATKVVMLMDSQKFGIHMPYTYARMRDVDYFVGDSALPAEQRRKLEAADIQVL